jgi:hypothetical protein
MLNRAGIVVRIVTAAAAIASLAHVGILIPRYILLDTALPLSIRLFVASIVVTVLAAIGGSALALILVVRSWSLPGARALALMLAALSTLWGSILRFIDISTTASDLHVQLQASTSFEIIVLSSAVIVAAAAFLRFSALFPAPLAADALPPSRGAHWLRRARIALLRGRNVWLVAALAGLTLLAYTPVSSRIVALIVTGSLDADRLLGADTTARRVWIGGLVAVAVTILLLMPVAAMILGVRNLFAGYRVAAADERRRVLWLVAGASIAAWMVLIPLIVIPLVALTPLSVDWLAYVVGLLWMFAPAVLVSTAGVAIFYSGAVDPALVLKRSTLYGILGAGAFLLFTVLESVLSGFFEAALGLPGLAGSIAAGCIAAGLMLLVRRALATLSSRTRLAPPVSTNGP